MKTLKQKIALVDAAFVQLECLNNIQWTPYRENLFRLAIEGEKSHRGSDFARFHRDAVTVSQCARMFTVRWIAGFLCRADKMPTIKNVLSLRPDVVLAAGLVANYRQEIRKALRKFDLKELAALDYVEFVGESRAPAA